MHTCTLRLWVATFEGAHDDVETAYESRTRNGVHGNKGAADRGAATYAHATTKKTHENSAEQHRDFADRTKPARLGEKRGCATACQRRRQKMAGPSGDGRRRTRITVCLRLPTLVDDDSTDGIGLEGGSRMLIIRTRTRTDAERKR